MLSGSARCYRITAPSTCVAVRLRPRETGQSGIEGKPGFIDPAGIVLGVLQAGLCGDLIADRSRLLRKRRYFSTSCRGVPRNLPFGPLLSQTRFASPWNERRGGFQLRCLTGFILPLSDRLNCNPETPSKGPDRANGPEQGGEATPQLRQIKYRTRSPSCVGNEVLADEFAKSGSQRRASHRPQHSPTAAIRQSCKNHVAPGSEKDTADIYIYSGMIFYLCNSEHFDAPFPNSYADCSLTQPHRVGELCNRRAFFFLFSPWHIFGNLCGCGEVSSWSKVRILFRRSQEIDIKKVSPGPLA